MKKNDCLKTKVRIVLSFVMFLLATRAWAQVTMSGALIGNGSYTTLGCAFKAIRPAQASANIGVSITANRTETGTSTLHAGNWVSLEIFPTTTGLCIASLGVNAPLIDLNGADRVTVDGRVTLAGRKDLTITGTISANTARSSTIRWSNGVAGNKIQYGHILGRTLEASRGILFFSSSSPAIGEHNNRFVGRNAGIQSLF
jgi:hypothetical protein